MKYIEYVYLGLSLLGMTYLITTFRDLNTQTAVFVIIGMTITSFMYSFRRNQRILMERTWEEHQAEEAAKAAEENPSEPN